MDAYPRIAAHGLIGDLQTAALVSTDGTIDWFCAPRFDSPSIFAALLDRRQGEFCRSLRSTPSTPPAALPARHSDTDHPVPQR